MMHKIRSLGIEGRGKERCTKGEKEKGKNHKGRVVIQQGMFHVCKKNKSPVHS